MLPSTPRTFIGSTTFTVAETAGCQQRGLIEAIHGLPEVEAVTVDLASGTVTVTASRPIDRADVAVAVKGAGYDFLP